MNQPDRPDTMFAETDGLSIAYQIWGAGERNIVLVPGIISHLEANLDRPGYRRWMRALAAIGRVAVFDKRGNGMSDRIQGAPTMDERVRDIEAVMDAAGMASATIIGVSEGGAMTCVFAATHPERVERLVVCGAYARGRLARGVVTEADVQEAVARFRSNWGKPGGNHPIAAFAPGPEDPAGQEAFARIERMSATPTTIAALYDLSARIDITAALPSISRPALILHRADEAPNGREAAQDFVGLIPGARYRTAPGDEHIPWEGDVDSYVAPIVEFITGAAPAAPQATRTLATVLFADLVDSTAHQARVGDEAWRRLMNRHDEICAAEVARQGGRLVKFTGDGMLATFGAPTSALACAAAVRRALSALGLEARFGAHTGEIELRGEDVSGLGVVVAARIMDLAAGGQVLASDLTRQLMLGAPYRFDDRGAHELKGVPDRWRLHEVTPA